MRRWLGWIAIAWLLAICAVALFAYGNSAPAVSLDDRTRAVAAQLRCPVCQGESVADSPAIISKAMRRYIRKELAAGRSPDQIKQFFIDKYGQRIVLSPPQSGIGDLAWLAPPLLLLGGLGFLITLVLDWRRRARVTSSAGREQYIDRVRAELAAETHAD